MKSHFPHIPCGTYAEEVDNHPARTEPLLESTQNGRVNQVGDSAAPSKYSYQLLPMEARITSTLPGSLSNRCFGMPYEIQG